MSRLAGEWVYGSEDETWGEVIAVASPMRLIAHPTLLDSDHIVGRNLTLSLVQIVT